MKPGSVRGRSSYHGVRARPLTRSSRDVDARPDKSWKIFGTASTGPFSHTLRYGPQMEDEPVPGQVRHPLQRARLLEQVGRARHDLQACLPSRPAHRLTVELQDNRVIIPDDQRRSLAYPVDA